VWGRVRCLSSWPIPLRGVSRLRLHSKVRDVLPFGLASRLGPPRPPSRSRPATTLTPPAIAPLFRVTKPIRSHLTQCSLSHVYIRLQHRRCALQPISTASTSSVAFLLLGSIRICHQRWRALVLSPCAVLEHLAAKYTGRSEQLQQGTGSVCWVSASGHVLLYLESATDVRI
jgi:hypothetical protein